MANDNSNVVVLDVATKLDIPSERVLEWAMKSELESVVVIGYRKDGEEYFASSLADSAEVVWLMEKAKKKLLEMDGD